MSRLILWGMLTFYLLFGVIVYVGVENGILHNTGYENGLNVDSNLNAAMYFLKEELVQENGHIDLFISYDSKIPEAKYTNSEAISYYLLINAKMGNEEEVKKTLDYIFNYMVHPQGYLMWKLDDKEEVVDDGANFASDADIRTINALLIAEKKWGEEYSQYIDFFASALERSAITEDNYLAPYGGFSGNIWTAEEVWLSYEDFFVFEELSKRRGNPWNDVYSNMKSATISAQLQNGLYNTELTVNREKGNKLDDGYSINSMWIMIRSSASDDEELIESAKKSLDFYKKKYETDGELNTKYYSDGESASGEEAPWVYAMVARAASNLKDREFANFMLNELFEFQVLDNSSVVYGSIIEGSITNPRVTQFTMQESILAMIAYKEEFT